MQILSIGEGSMEERTDGGTMNEVGNKSDSRGWLPNRREFLSALVALGLAGWTEQAIEAVTEKLGGSGLPDRPEEQPLDFRALARAFDAYVMDPSHGVNLRANDGRQVFTSALEGTEDGGLT